ncbi:hypothetical protein WJX74_004494 [Apatococcus lobatus]|uniref:Uncharacterized protein n=1 Tax=Apatococcus lobatus TaxID=904363 RepID=A0AAW1RPS6_9CHLO
MQRTISSEVGSSALYSLSRAWSSGSGSSTVQKFEDALAGGLQQVFGARMQSTAAVDAAAEPLVSRAQPARPDVIRTQGAAVPAAGTRSIHSSIAQPEKEAPAPVIGTRDTCYHSAPACIDITAERRAAAEAQMTWEAYIKLHKNNSC